MGRTYSENAGGQTHQEGGAGVVQQSEGGRPPDGCVANGYVGRAAREGSREG